MHASELFPIILTYGTADEHRALAGQLREAGVPPGNCLVVHNPSTPDEPLPEIPLGWRAIRMDRNGGYAAGMNRGIGDQRSRGGSALLLLTHDSRLRGEAVHALLAALERRPDFGVLGFVLDRIPDDRSFGARQFPDGSVAHIQEQPPAVDGIAEVPWVDGSALAVRVDALPSHDPLPAHYFMYFEEAWLCRSLQRRGWRTGTVIDAMAESSPGWSRRPAAQAYLFTRNGIDFIARMYGRRSALRFARHQVQLACRAVPKPGGKRFRDRDRRRRDFATAFGRAIGLRDAVRRRWGPPPPCVLRRGDITGT